MSGGGAGPLAGIRIIDLTQALAGPFCTMLLADLGADVIKVEPPEGDMTRDSGPFRTDDAERAFGGYFASINRNKRSAVIDLKTARGRDALLELTSRADAFVENSRAGVMERLGLGYEVLRERNPRLVYGAIRGFGDPRTGQSPYVNWPAFDVIAQAMGGLISVNGTEEGEMLRVGVGIGDIYPATLGALGITAALLHAQRTGEGQFMDVAMYDAVLALCEAIVYRYSYRGYLSKPSGNPHPALVPFELFATRDGACAIAAPTDKHWAVLCQIMNRPELAEDERTRTQRARRKHAALVREAVSTWSGRLSTAEVVEALAERVPVGPVHNAQDILADPHPRTRGMLQEVEQPGSATPVTLVGSPIKLTATPAGIYRRPPKLGEHTREVLAELDLEANASPTGGSMEEKR